MSNREIAIILYNLACDMDKIDYLEEKENDISELCNDIEKAGETLKKCLEMIAYNNR